MSDLILDILEGRIGHREAQAVCNAGGKMLKVVEMTHKYGRKMDEAHTDEIVLDLASEPRQIKNGAP